MFTFCSFAVRSLENLLSFRYWKGNVSTFYRSQVAGAEEGIKGKEAKRLETHARTRTLAARPRGFVVSSPLVR